MEEGSTNDGALEIFSFRGAMYLGTVKAGVVRPRPLAQCRDVIIESTDAYTGKSMKIQVDGETQTIIAPFKIVVRRSAHTALLLQGKHPALGTCDVCC